MLRIKRIFFAVVVALCALNAAESQDPVVDTAARAKSLDAAAVKAYQSKDYKSFLSDEKQAMELDPVNPRLIYNVACGESLQGNASEAVRWLDQLLARKLDLGAEADGDFAGIRKSPEWAGFEVKLAELRKPVVSSRVLFKLEDRGLVAAGVAVDGQTGDTYIASIRERKILRRTKEGKVSDFISEGQDGFMAGASLAIDSKRNLLYATTAAAPFMTGYKKEQDGLSGVYAFDLGTGKLVRKALVAADGKQRFLNAMEIDSAGNVYVANSAIGEIYIMRSGASELELFVAPGVFQSTQGLLLTKDGKNLLVADYLDGLWSLYLSTMGKQKIKSPADVWLGGLDGLSRVDGGLISVQIGVQPQRVIWIGMDAKEQQITKVEVLEMNHPEYDGPIQGGVNGSDFIYVANSQLSLVNGQSGTFALDRAQPTVVLELPVKKWQH